MLINLGMSSDNSWFYEPGEKLEKCKGRDHIIIGELKPGECKIQAINRLTELEGNLYSP
jgi:hypothetical protein